MQLSDWLSQKELSRAAFARLVGVTPSHITGLCNGGTLPSLTLAWEIERATSGAVSPADWRPSDDAAGAGDQGMAAQ